MRASSAFSKPVTLPDPPLLIAFEERPIVVRAGAARRSATRFRPACGAVLPQPQDGDLVGAELCVPRVAFGSDRDSERLAAFDRLPSVMTPVVVIRATLPVRDWANQTDPSGAAAMPSGPPPGASGNSVTAFVAGSRNPTELSNRFVNYTFPSVAIAIPRGPFGPPPRGVSVMPPVTGSSLPILFAPNSVILDMQPVSTGCPERRALSAPPGTDRVSDHYARESAIGFPVWRARPRRA
jgi:hypothetical protein